MAENAISDLTAITEDELDPHDEAAVRFCPGDIGGQPHTVAKLGDLPHIAEHARIALEALDSSAGCPSQPWVLRLVTVG